MDNHTREQVKQAIQTEPAKRRTCQVCSMPIYTYGKQCQNCAFSRDLKRKQKAQ
jgi:hypothetical protein